MVEQDTIKLLRECDAGVKMGISSIDDVLDHVKKEDFRKKLTKCREEHQDLQIKILQELEKYQDDRRLQYGCQIPEPVSEPVQSSR